MSENPSSASSDSGDFGEGHPSTTAISTVAVQAGGARIVLAILKSGNWIKVRIQQMVPDLYEIGSSLSETERLKEIHDQLITKLAAKQNQISELLSRADDLVTQKPSNQTEVYAAMASSLGRGWRDLQDVLRQRSNLLDIAILFYQAALQFETALKTAEEQCCRSDPGADPGTVRQSIQDLDRIKRSFLELSRSTLTRGTEVLNLIRKLGTQSMAEGSSEATLATCRLVEERLVRLHDHRRHVDDLWKERYQRLDKLTHFMSFENNLLQMVNWFYKIGEPRLNSYYVGHNLSETEATLSDLMGTIEEAREVRNSLWRLIRTVKQMVECTAHHHTGPHATSGEDSSGHEDEDSPLEGDDLEARQDRRQKREWYRLDSGQQREFVERVATAERHCADFMERLETRRKGLSQAVIFYSEAQVLLERLRTLEMEMGGVSAFAPGIQADLFLTHLGEIEVRIPGLRQTAVGLMSGEEASSCSESSRQAVAARQEEVEQAIRRVLQECQRLQLRGEKVTIRRSIEDRLTMIFTWLTEVGFGTLRDYGAPGASVQSVTDFLDRHRRLDLEMLAKENEIQAVLAEARHLLSPNDLPAVEHRIKEIQSAWTRIRQLVLFRLDIFSGFLDLLTTIQQDEVHFQVFLDRLLEVNMDSITSAEMDELARFLSGIKIQLEHQQNVLSGVVDKLSTADDETLQRKVPVDFCHSQIQVNIERLRDLDCQWTLIQQNTGDQQKFRSELTIFFSGAKQLEDFFSASEARFVSGLITVTSLNQLQSLVNEHIQSRATVDQLYTTTINLGAQITGPKWANMVLRFPQTQPAVSEVRVVTIRLQDRRRQWDVLWESHKGALEERGRTVRMLSTIGEVEEEIVSTRRKLDQVQRTLTIEHQPERADQSLLTIEAEIPNLQKKVRSVLDCRLANLPTNRIKDLETNFSLLMEDMKRHRSSLLLHLRYRHSSQEVESYTSHLDIYLDRMGKRMAVAETIPETREIYEDLADQKRRGEQLAEREIPKLTNLATQLYGPEGKEKVQPLVFRFGQSVGRLKKMTVDAQTSMSEKLEDEAKQKQRYPPRITRPLRDFQVDEGSRVNLDCAYISGAQPDHEHEDPLRVEWFKDGAPIPPQALNCKTQTFPEGAILTIPEVFEDDAGKYTCRISNSVGEDQTTGFLGVIPARAKMQPPRFTKPLKSMELTEGDPLEMECTVVGDEPIEIAWFKNEQPVHLDPAYEPTIEPGNVCKLKSREPARPDMTDQYVCLATNPVGEATTSGQVTVKPGQPPIITEPLHDEICPPNQHLQLVVKYLASAPFNVTWFCNNEVIPDPDNAPFQPKRAPKLGQQRPPSQPPRRHVFHPEPGVTVLDIRDTLPIDAALYRVTVANRMGQATTEGKIDFAQPPVPEELFEPTRRPPVEEPPPREGSPPVFLEYLRNKTVTENQKEVTLDCVVIGDPEPEVVWLHNGKPVKSDKHVQVLRKGKKQTLLFKDVNPQDLGQYKCVATNPYGQAETVCKMNVIPEIREDIEPRPKTPTDEEIIMPSKRPPAEDQPDFDFPPSPPPEPFDEPFLPTKRPPVEEPRQGPTPPPEPVEEPFLPTKRPPVEEPRQGPSPPPVDERFDQIKQEKQELQRSTASEVRELKETKEIHHYYHHHFESVLHTHLSPRSVSLPPEELVRREMCTQTDASERQQRMLSELRTTVQAPENFESRAEVSRGLEVTPMVQASRYQTTLEAAVDHQVEVTSAYHSQFQRDHPMAIVPMVPEDFTTQITHQIDNTSQHEVHNHENFTTQLTTNVQPKFDPINVAFNVPSEPPLFVQPLAYVETLPGERVVLEGVVKGDPQPTITWLKGGKPLLETPDIQIMYEDCKVTLIIHSMTPAHEGEYTCEAVNLVGLAESSATVTLIEITQITSTQTRIHGSASSGSYYYRGANITSTAQIPTSGPMLYPGHQQCSHIDHNIPPHLHPGSGGASSFEMTFNLPPGHQPNNLVLGNGYNAPPMLGQQNPPFPQQHQQPQYKPAVPPHQSILKKTAPQVQNEAPPNFRPLGGKFNPKKTNAPNFPAPPIPRPFQVQTHPQPQSAPPHHSPLIHPTPSIPLNSMPPANQMQPVPNAGFPLAGNKASNQPIGAPELMGKLPQAVLLMEGKTVVLENKIRTPNPETTVIWYKNGSILEPSTRHRLIHNATTGELSLTITMCLPEDEGEYYLMVRNPYGQVEAITYILPDDRYQRMMRAGSSGVLPLIRRGSSSRRSSSQMSETSSTDDAMRRGLVGELEDRFRQQQEDKRNKRAAKKKQTPAVPAWLAQPMSGRGQPPSNQHSSPQGYPGAPSSVPNDRPTFLRRPESQDVEEGGPLRVEVAVGGRPPPDISWMKDGRPVNNDTTHKLLINEDGAHSLLFTTMSLSDAGQWTCIARSSAGEDTSTFQLVVRPKEVPQRPQFVQKLQPVEASQGQTVTFSAKADGSPLPMISWQKDGKPLQPDGSRVLIQVEGTTIHLILVDVQVSDAGFYQCTAVNKSGNAITRAKLTVSQNTSGSSAVVAQQHDKSFSQPKPPHSGPGSSHSNGPSLNATNTPSGQGSGPRFSNHQAREMTPEDLAFQFLDMALPPTLSGPLKCSHRIITEYPETIEGVIEEGNDNGIPLIVLNEPVHISVTVFPVGDPTMKAVWLRSGKPMQEGPRHNITFDRGHASLEIEYFLPEDEGSYQFVGENAHGKIESNRIYLVVSKEDEEKYTESAPAPPDFYRTPQSTRVPEGARASFLVRVTGHPPPSLSWTLNGRQISEDQLKAALRKAESMESHDTDQSPARFFYDGVVHRVEIVDCRPEMAGILACVASNQYGEKRVEAKLEVVRMNEWTIEDDEKRLLKELAPSESDSIRPSLGISGIAPVFKIMLQPVKAEEGEEAIFYVEFDGLPTPDLVWFRENVPIESSSDYQITINENESKLRIPEVFREDGGTFSCTATNFLGTAHSRACLIVLVDGQPIESTASTSLTTVPDAPDLSPLIVTPLSTDFYIAVGDKATLTCRIGGRPEPQVFWQCNGWRLSAAPNPRLRILRNQVQSTEGEDDTGPVWEHTLMLCGALSDDQGLYECVAVNRAGKNATGAFITVKPGSRSKSLESSLLSIVEEEKPQITHHLTSLSLAKGRPAKFTVDFEARPEADVGWFKDSMPLIDNKDYNMFSEGQRFHLEIPEVSLKDAGIYSALVVNPLGEAKSSARLTVLSESNTDKENVEKKPSFQKQLPKEMRVANGEDFKLEIIAECNPSANIKWTFNNATIDTDSAKYSATVNPVGGPNSTGCLQANLLVKAFNAVEDVGLYRVLVETSLGSITSEVHVYSDALPVFTKSLPTSITAPKGGSISLVTATEPASGPIRFHWHVNDTEITPTTLDCRLIETENQSELIIDRVTSDHVGSVVCEAISSAGRARNICALSFDAHNIQDDKSGSGQFGFADELPAEIYKTVGESLSVDGLISALRPLECPVEGNTGPVSAIWTLNGVWVEESCSGRVESGFNETTGKVFLALNCLQERDSGPCVCIVTNEGTSVQTATHINVKSDGSSSDTSTTLKASASDDTETTLKCSQDGDYSGAEDYSTAASFDFSPDTDDQQQDTQDQRSFLTDNKMTFVQDTQWTLKLSSISSDAPLYPHQSLHSEKTVLLSSLAAIQSCMHRGYVNPILERDAQLTYFLMTYFSLNEPMVSLLNTMSLLNNYAVIMTSPRIGPISAPVIVV